MLLAHPLHHLPEVARNYEQIVVPVEHSHPEVDRALQINGFVPYVCHEVQEDGPLDYLFFWFEATCGQDCELDLWVLLVDQGALLEEGLERQCLLAVEHTMVIGRALKYIVDTHVILFHVRFNLILSQLVRPLIDLSDRGVPWNFRCRQDRLRNTRAQLGPIHHLCD